MAKIVHAVEAKKYETIFLRLTLVSFIVFIFTSALTQTNAFYAIDHAVNLYMFDNANAVLIAISSVISDLSDSGNLFAIGIVLGLLYLVSRKLHRASVMLIASLVTLKAVQYLKAYFISSRPINAFEFINGASYPSGHAAFGAAIFFTLIYVFAPVIKSELWRKVFIAFCVIMTAIIGLSRLLLNVHWASDVVGGWALGIFIATGSVTLVQFLSSHYRGKI